MASLIKIEAELIEQSDETIVLQTEQVCDQPAIEHPSNHIQNVNASSYEQNRLEAGVPAIELDAKFSSFDQLRKAIEIYQKEHFVQLIVKDSKILQSESTRRVGRLIG